MKFGMIYKVTNIVNGKCYIGQTLMKLEGRKRKHASKAFVTRDDSYFCRAIRKYGIENFKWEILVKDIPIKRLNLEEMAAIRDCGSFGENGYNSNRGGGGNNGYKHNEETKQKLSELKMGIHPSEETRKRLSEARKGNKNSLGRHLSEEQKKKISLALSGRIQSEEWKKKNSEAHKGKVFSREHRKNLSLARIGITHTDEWKKQHSIDMMGEKNPMYGRRRPDTSERNRQRCQAL